MIFPVSRWFWFIRLPLPPKRWDLFTATLLLFFDFTSCCFYLRIICDLSFLRQRDAEGIGSILISVAPPNKETVLSLSSSFDAQWGMLDCGAGISTGFGPGSGENQSLARIFSHGNNFSSCRLSILKKPVSAVRSGNPRETAVAAIMASGSLILYARRSWIVSSMIASSMWRSSQLFKSLLIVFSSFAEIDGKESSSIKLISETARWLFVNGFIHSFPDRIYKIAFVSAR